MNDFFSEYGYCIIPQGTILYRKGKIMSDTGAFFALYPDWAVNVSNHTEKTVDSYIVVSEIKVLFLISHLNSMGLPQTSIVKLYNEQIENFALYDDLDIKWRIDKCRRKLIQFLEEKKISGWLSTQENSYPLEIYLVPSCIIKMEKATSLIQTNALMQIDIFPNDGFLKASLKNINRNLPFLKSLIENKDESDFSILEKIFYTKL